VDRAGPAGTLSARRLYAPALPALGAELELGPEAAQHARVLRLAQGDLVSLFDGRGQLGSARIVALGKGGLRCELMTSELRAPRVGRVVLVQCLPKAGKLDDIVRMTTELGVAEIALAESEYCVTRAARPADHKRERLERIAIEAARQAEQDYLPVISAPRPLDEVLARAPVGAFRAACVERTSDPLPEALEVDELWLVIGPEGGLSSHDRAVLQARAFTPVALGQTILRTETAAVVGVALALERLGRGR
jgi:16S rRNA (uracil1498-N3)-methyltransferase